MNSKLWLNKKYCMDKKDLQNKIEVYNMYIESGKEPPMELLYSIKNLEKKIKSIESLFNTENTYKKIKK